MTMEELDTREEELWSAICAVEDAINALKELGDDYDLDVQAMRETLHDLQREHREVEDEIAELAQQERDEMTRAYYLAVM